MPNESFTPATDRFGDELPVLPIRNALLFPGAVAPFDIGRDTSVALIEAVHTRADPVIGVFAQRDPNTDEPSYDDLYPVGCAARILKALKHGSGNYSLILQGEDRVRLEAITRSHPYLTARVVRVEDCFAEHPDIEAQAQILRQMAKEFIHLLPELPVGVEVQIDSCKSASDLADFVSANLDVPLNEKAKLIETVEVNERLRRVTVLLMRQREILRMRERISSHTDREAYHAGDAVLQQQSAAVQAEPGESSDIEQAEPRRLGSGRSVTSPIMPDPPTKRQTALALLEQSSVVVRLDPRRDEVVVPPQFKTQPQLILRIGHDLPKPISDLDVDDEAISGTLVFPAGPYFCWIPWHAVFALEGENVPQAVWIDDVPDELSNRAERQPGRPRLRVASTCTLHSSATAKQQVANECCEAAVSAAVQRTIPNSQEMAAPSRISRGSRVERRRRAVRWRVVD